MIKIIPFKVSAELKREIDAFENTRAEVDLDNFFKERPTPREYAGDFLSIPEGLEIFRKIENIGKPLSILDVGCGMGEVDVYLSSLGHKVTCLEPSPVNCRFIERAADIYGLTLSIYQTIAENIHKINETFDAIFFNGSLHHCDEPRLALRNCYKALNNGGILLVANEPVLHFFRSKVWYEHLLKNHPEKIGHYGGNEHIYYYREYLEMIAAAGFKKINAELSMRYSDYELSVRRLESCARSFEELARRSGKLNFIWSFKQKCGNLSRKVFYRSTSFFNRYSLLRKLMLFFMGYISFLKPTFIAVKSD